MRSALCRLTSFGKRFDEDCDSIIVCFQNVLIPLALRGHVPVALECWMQSC